VEFIGFGYRAGVPARQVETGVPIGALSKAYRHDEKKRSTTRPGQHRFTGNLIRRMVPRRFLWK
jgi:hypothetical protein